MANLEIKKLLDEQRKTLSEDMKGYMGTFVESVNSKIELIAEQHLSMANKIDSLDSKVESLNIQMIEVNIRLGHIEDQLRRKVDYEDFEKLEKRVALLEAQK
jgi:hypothetical protein